MKWKEILKGIFSAQSGIMLSQAQKQIGKKRPVLLLSDARCGYMCASAHASSKMCMKSAILLDDLLWGIPFFPHVLG